MRIFLTFIVILFSIISESVENSEAQSVVQSDVRCWDYNPCTCKETWWCSAYKQQEVKRTPPQLSNLSFDPGFFKANTLNKVIVSVTLSGDLNIKPEGIEIYFKDTSKLVGNLKDDGVGSDLTSADYIYSGIMEFDNKAEHGSCFQFIAKTTDVEPKESEICVSEFMEQSKAQSPNILKDGLHQLYNGNKLILNISKKSNVKSLRLLERKHKGQLQQINLKNYYIFTFEAPPKTFKDLKSRKKLLENESEVESVEFDSITQVE